LKQYYITESSDFVYETNILGATIPDSIKVKQHNTYTATQSLDDSISSVCGKDSDFKSVNPSSPITITYFIKIPMTTFNLFDKMRYLPTFFGNWTLDIVPTLENMIMKIIRYNVFDTKGCTHNNKILSAQCYGVGTECYFPTVAGVDPYLTWIMLTPRGYRIAKANFYTSQFNLIPDRYISLTSQFSQQPLQLLFVKFC
jgi:hypothetical protein